MTPLNTATLEVDQQNTVMVVEKEEPHKMKKSYKTEKACVDGNWAVAHSAYRINDCAFIFPITPSSPMGEYSDEFATKHKKNVFGQEMKIVEMVCIVSESFAHFFKSLTPSDIS